MQPCLPPISLAPQPPDQEWFARAADPAKGAQPANLLPEAMPWYGRLAARWRGMPRRRRAGALGAALILANEVRGIIVVITIGLEPLRVMLAAI